MSLYLQSQEALDDWRDIIEYTLGQHGEAQTVKYAADLIKCIEAIAKNSGYYKDIKVKGRTVRVKHCQKHYIFGLLRESSPMIIIAFFHERMEIMTRLKDRLSH